MVFYKNQGRDNVVPSPRLKTRSGRKRKGKASGFANLWQAMLDQEMVNCKQVANRSYILQPKTYEPAKSYELQTALSGCLPEAASLIHRACTADTCSRDLQQRLAFKCKGLLANAEDDIQTKMACRWTQSRRQLSLRRRRKLRRSRLLTALQVSCTEAHQAP